MTGPAITADQIPLFASAVPRSPVPTTQFGSPKTMASNDEKLDVSLAAHAAAVSTTTVWPAATASVCSFPAALIPVCNEGP